MSNNYVLLDTQDTADWVVGSGTPTLGPDNVNVAKNVAYTLNTAAEYVRNTNAAARIIAPTGTYPYIMGGGWFNLPSQGGVLSHIFAQSDGATTNSVFEVTLLASGDLRVRAYEDASANKYVESVATAAQAAINGQTAWDDGTDKNLEFKVNGNDLNIYLEGTQCVYASQDVTGAGGGFTTISATPAPLTLGDLEGGSANGCTGKIWRVFVGQFILSSSLRSDSAITTAYNREVALFAANTLCPADVPLGVTGGTPGAVGHVKPLLGLTNGDVQMLLDADLFGGEAQSLLPGFSPLLSVGDGEGPIFAINPVTFKRKYAQGGSVFTSRPEEIFSNRRKHSFGSSIFTARDEIYTRRRYSEFPTGVDSELNLPPNVQNPIPDQVATEGILFDYVVPEDTFDDPEGDPLIWSAQAVGGGPLPSWLTFNPTIRRFLGTPTNTDVGVVTVEVCAEDPYTGPPGTCTPLNITVLNVNEAPIAVGSIPDQNIFTNQDFVFQFDAAVFDDPDFIHGDFLVYEATLANGDPLPEWLGFDSDTRTFAGIPPDSAAAATPTDPPAVIEVRVTAIDTGGLTASIDFFITITRNVYEPLFPEDISYGSSGGPGFNTAIVEVESGAEHRIARWEEAKRVYNVAYGIKKHSDLTRLSEFYLAQKGSFGRFRYKDWLDFNTTEDHSTLVENPKSVTAFDQFIGTGDGTTQNFQLIKRYTDGVKTIIRNITKPVSGTIKVAVDGVIMTSGWSVDVTTGILSFTSAPLPDAEITAGFEFHVPCRFGSEVDGALKANVETFSTGSLQDIVVQELREANFVEEDFFYGGAVDLDINADTFISVMQGRVFRITSGSFSNLEVILPAIDNLAPGGPYFYITNRGTNFLRIVPEQGIGVGQELANLQMGETITVLLADDNGTIKWVAI